MRRRMLLRCIKMTSRAEKTHIESIGASAFASHAEIGSAAAAQIEPSDTLCVERLTAKNTAIIAAKTGSPVIKPSAAPTDTPFPPRNEKYTGQQWPTMHAAPASALPASPPKAAPISIAAAVFTALSINVAIPAFMP